MPDDIPPHNELDDEEVDDLLEALRKLRYYYRIMYKALASKISTAENPFSEVYIWKVNARRTRPSRVFEKAVYDYAEVAGYDLGVDSVSLADYQLSVAHEMSLDREKLIEDIVRINGWYICFVKNREGYSASIIKLYEIDKQKSWPEFSMWNPDLMVQGYYFVYEGMIHMIGHIADSALPRLMTFWREGSDSPVGHYIGTSALSNRIERSLLSWAYLERIDRSEIVDMRRAKWRGLGLTTDLEALRGSRPHVADYFEGKSIVGVKRMDG